MWPSAIILAGYFGSTFLEQPPVLAVQDCVIMGKVYNIAGETGANLFSNCPLAITQKARVLIIKGRHRDVEVRFPENPGVYDFVYHWGQSTAQLDNHDVDIAFGPAGET